MTEDWESKYKTLLPRYNANVELTKTIIAAKDQLQIKNETILAQLENCETQMLIQKTINHNLMTEMNKQKDAYVEDLHRLEEKIKKLEKELETNDNFDKLGY